MPRPAPTSFPRTQTSQDPTPRLSVVVVNYHSWDETTALTRHLLAGQEAQRGAAEVVVVDNHSPPHRLLSRLRRWPGVSVRRWGRNRGFGRAATEGVRLSRGEWLLLLNPDVSVSADFLDRVLAFSEKVPDRVGILGFRLCDADGSPQPSVGKFPTFLGTVTGLLRPRKQRKYLKPHPQQPCTVDWLSGCCLLVRRACWSQLGGFDSRFFLYYEDVDLCRRARLNSWTVQFEPSLSVVHHRPLHNRSVPPHIRLFTRHGLLTYADLHWTKWQVRCLAGLVRVEAKLRRLGAWVRRDRRAGQVFAALDRLAADVAAGRPEEARRRLERIARQEEQRAAAIVRRRAEPQSSRSAPSVSDECDPVRAAGDGDHRG